jgi:hypothetical protein
VKRVRQIGFVCASAATGLVVACPTDPPDVGECGVESCYLPCNDDDECDDDDEFCFLSEDGSLCLPECDGSQCPETGECIFNPDSNAVSCEATGTCDDPEAECLENVSGAMVCLLPPSHCVPRCDVEDCPRGLVCDENAICVVP